jgi:hypothetical protein
MWSPNHRKVFCPGCRWRIPSRRKVSSRRRRTESIQPNGGGGGGVGLYNVTDIVDVPPAGCQRRKAFIDANLKRNLGLQVGTVAVQHDRGRKANWEGR